jgi:hypothetical protein
MVRLVSMVFLTTWLLAGVAVAQPAPIEGNWSVSDSIPVAGVVTQPSTALNVTVNNSGPNSVKVWPIFDRSSQGTVC